MPDLIISKHYDLSIQGGQSIVVLSCLVAAIAYICAPLTKRLPIPSIASGSAMRKLMATLIPLIDPADDGAN